MIKNILFVITIGFLFAGCNSVFSYFDTKNIQKNEEINKKAQLAQKYNPSKLKSKESISFSKNKSNSFDFDLIKKGKESNNTLLIVGGIQGDEPGGFIAASLIATHYDITKGAVWTVPNLNFYSIIKRSRGPYGDMNRKFAKLSKSDPDYELIQRIKGYITHPDVKMIINLHDGSGFYRKKYIDKWHQPRRWGQSIVIDQKYMSSIKTYGEFDNIAQAVASHLNKHILKKEDIFHVKNTHTRFKKSYEEKEMAKTLTYFAIVNGKSAFGNETSKSLPTHQRVYYKLLALEKHMSLMGIEFKRKFKMNPQSIKKIINEDIFISFYDGKISLPLGMIKDVMKYFPVNKDGKIDFIPSNPLIKIIKNKNSYTIFYGNRELVDLKADYCEYGDIKNEGAKLNIDGKDIHASFGKVIQAKKYFKIYSNKKYRVNVIGFVNKNGEETDVNIRKKDIISKYSIDKKSNLYRVEFYDKKIKNKFIGMYLIKFNNKK